MIPPRRANSPARGGLRGTLAGAAAWGLLAASPADAGSLAPPPNRFSHLSTAEGLPDPQIRAVFRDRTGFVWIGTVSGLDRYDGLAFREFRHDPSDPGSLGPGTVRALMEDRRGRLWVGLIRGGISVFDPTTERIGRAHV